MPGTDTDPVLIEFLRREFFAVFQGMEAVDRLPILTREPERVEGRLAFADGASWNPGAGRGLYCFEGTAWRKL